MATIYTVPKEIPFPEFNWKEVSKYKKDIEDHEARLKDWAIKRCEDGGKSTENVGEVIQFPVADGYAQYMVASIKPLQLIHLEYWDAYQFEYANRLTAKDVKDKVNQKKALNKLFGGRNLH